MSARHRQAKKQRAALVEECDRYRRLVDAYSLVLKDVACISGGRLVDAYNLVLEDVACLSGDTRILHKRMEWNLERVRWVEGEIATHDALHEGAPCTR
jgi:hypothetical protein